MKVVVKDGNVNLALKKLKKKVEESGILIKLLEKQYYEKPTTVRKRRAAAAKARWKRKLKSQQAPKINY